MPRLAVILLVSWAYIGCAGSPARQTDMAPYVARHAPVRWNVSDPRMVDAIVSSSVSRPRVGSVVWVEGSDPALLMRLNETDIAIAWGRDGGSMLEAAGDRYDVGRLPRWDRGYSLWLEPSARWLNDPLLRKWIAERIERASMLDYLFDGRGDAMTSWIASDDIPRWDPVDRRPLSNSSEPRFALGFDREDPHAGRIAARLRAGFAADRIFVELRAMNLAELHADVSSGALHAAVVVHLPTSAEPALALGDICGLLGPGAHSARVILSQSAGLADLADRTASALAAERVLIDDARLVPLLRLHAYLAVDRKLGGLETGDFGVIDFAEAWWHR